MMIGWSTFAATTLLAAGAIALSKPPSKRAWKALGLVLCLASAGMTIWLSVWFLGLPVATKTAIIVGIQIVLIGGIIWRILADLRFYKEMRDD